MVQLRNRQFQSHRTVQARAQSGAAWRVSVEGAWRCLQLGRVEFALLQFRTKGLLRKENNENQNTI